MKKTKSLLILAVFCFLLSTKLWAGNNSLAATTIPGDANCDGNVNVADLLTIINHFLESNPQPFCFENADVNGDGEVNLLDGIETVDIILSGGFVCGVSNITDIDGNVYNTVQIGYQCWMKENLKTTRYRNGISIEFPGSNNNTWQNNVTGAYAWNNNDIGWKEAYGALYNWYAVNNANGICPAGWYVASFYDWEELIALIGGASSPNANLLKSCRQVNSPLGAGCNTTLHPRWDQNASYFGTDDYSFSALPGGFRFNNGTYSNIGYSSRFYTSTEYSAEGAYHYFITTFYPQIFRSGLPKNYGYSVRCVKD